MVTNKKSHRLTVVAYWITTSLLCFGMLSGGLAQVLRFKANADGIVHLGYPLYFMSLLGSWKIAGVVALLIPRNSLVKEWAYAGFFFAMSGAVISHITSGDDIGQWITPFIFMLLTVASWKLRPAERRLIS